VGASYNIIDEPPDRHGDDDDDDDARLDGSFPHAPTPSLVVAHAVDATRRGDDEDGNSGGFAGPPLNPYASSSRSASSSKATTMIFIVSVIT